MSPRLSIPPALVLKLREWLGYDGCAFFSVMKEIYGTVSPVYQEPGEIPNMAHMVHHREGMSVRNFMRRSGECVGWTDHDFDNNWTKAIELAIYA